MDKVKEQKYLNGWGFNNRKECEKFISEIIVSEGLEIKAQIPYKIFSEKIREWKKEFIKNCGKRFYMEIRDPEDGLVKEPKRIVEKMLESCFEYEIWEKQDKENADVEEVKKYYPSNFLLTMKDIIRFRIVCNYLSDIYDLDEKIRDFVKESDKFELEDSEDHIETPYSIRKAGHRAIQYRFRFSDVNTTFPFEVQLMTMLQNAWDKKDHHLIYEHERIGEGADIPITLKNRIAAMSDALYVADTMFNKLKEDITKRNKI